VGETAGKLRTIYWNCLHSESKSEMVLSVGEIFDLFWSFKSAWKIPYPTMRPQREHLARLSVEPRVVS
jgi:hypothetical protein